MWPMMFPSTVNMISIAIVWYCSAENPSDASWALAPSMDMMSFNLFLLYEQNLCRKQLHCILCINSRTYTYCAIAPHGTTHSLLHFSLSFTVTISLSFVALLSLSLSFSASSIYIWTLSLCQLFASPQAAKMCTTMQIMCLCVCVYSRIAAHSNKIYICTLVSSRTWNDEIKPIKRAKLIAYKVIQ